MIDLHAHVLPGIDDGPKTLADSLDLLRAAHADGIARVAATPHVREDYPTRPEEMERLLAEVREAARAEGIPIEVLPGGEIALTQLAELEDDDLRRFGLGGNPALLLLEFPYQGWPLALQEQAFRLAARGFTVVLAHPERSAEVQEEPTRLAPLVEAGVLVQLTAASVDGRLGRRPQQCARALLDAGLAHVLASDAHAPAVRAAGLSAAAEALDSPELALWLTDAVPRALLAGEPLPARPARGRRTIRLPWHR